MEFRLRFAINNTIFVKNPEDTELGQQIVQKAIDLIATLGFEQFTFKKLAAEINSTEATIYRYFENKHRILLYILNWYWSYLEFLITYNLAAVTNQQEKLRLIINLLVNELPESSGKLDYNKKNLQQIVTSEGSKVYLTKEVISINKNEVFKPYKDLCGTIATVILGYNPNYKFARSLSTTLIEASHFHPFFCKHLPRLTDVTKQNKNTASNLFLQNLLFSSLNFVG
jgi:hypothetical protein